MTSPRRTFLRLAVGATVLPLLSSAVVFGGTGQAGAIFAEPEILLFNAAWMAAPFLLGALVFGRSPGGRIGGLLGFALMAVLWSAMSVGGWRAQSGEGGGADIGLGILLLGAPILVLLVIAASALVGRMGGG
jgi:hypothetical protein